MGKRRADGEGAAFKRKVTRKNGSTYVRWEGAVTIGHTLKGGQKRRTVYGKTQAEVLDKLDKVKRQLSDGTFSDTKLTVSDYLDKWLQEKERTLKPTTIERKYRYCLDKHIKPRIGKVGLEKLKPMQVQSMVGDIADAAGVPTANNCRRVLFTAMKQAVRWQLLVRNVVEAVAPLPEQPREMTLWTPEQAARFLDASRDNRLYALFYLDMATGLRRGELLALRWHDIQGRRGACAAVAQLRQGRVHLFGTQDQKRAEAGRRHARRAGRSYSSP